MNENQKRAFTGLLAFVVLAGFTTFHIWAFWHLVKSDQKLTLNPDLSTVMTAVSGVIAAVVAMAFKAELAMPHASGTEAPTSNAQKVMSTLKNFITPDKYFSLETMTTLYVLCYFLTGITALIMTLVVDPTIIPDLTKNHGLACSGLIIAIAKSFFSLAPAPRT
jgi:hypothetical protein